jgi:hypothetical protein
VGPMGGWVSGVRTKLLHRLEWACLKLLYRLEWARLKLLDRLERARAEVLDRLKCVCPREVWHNREIDRKLTDSAYSVQRV